MRHARRHGQQSVRARDARGDQAHRGACGGSPPRAGGARPAAAAAHAPTARGGPHHARAMASRHRRRRPGPVRRPVIRAAAPRDNAAIAAIWNRAVLETTATTDTEPRSPAAQRAWLVRHTEDYPAIVAVDGGEVVAFGALTPYRPKPSYAHTVENSVYVREGWRGKGLGGLILDRLVEQTRARGHRSLIARITASNEASLLLHERHGFV